MINGEATRSCGNGPIGGESLQRLNKQKINMLNLGPFRIVGSEEMCVERQSESHVLLVPEPLVDKVGLLKAFLVYSPGLPFGILRLEQEHQTHKTVGAPK